MPCRFPGPHPGGKLRGLAWGISRPTPRGGSLKVHTQGGLQAHTQGDPTAHTQGGVSQHALRQTPPTATAAGGTHPTGMHSQGCC